MDEDHKLPYNTSGIYNPTGKCGMLLPVSLYRNKRNRSKEINVQKSRRRMLHGEKVDVIYLGLY